ncbi:MAG: hypothetical protein ACOWWR_20375 [Eubacteriales bacterium]
MSKKTLILGIALGALAVIVVAFFIIISFLNNRAEEEISEKVDQAIIESRLDGILSYKNIDVSSVKGTIEVEGISFNDPDLSFDADSVSVKLPVSEVMSLVKKPDDTIITDIFVQINGLNLTDTAQEISLAQNKWELRFQGNIHTGYFGDTPEVVPEDFDPKISFISINSTGTTLKSSIGEMKLGKTGFEAKGNFRLADIEEASLSDEYSSLIKKMEAVSISFSGYTLDLEDEMKESILMSLNMLFGPVPFLEDPRNWEITDFRLEGGLKDEKAEIRDLSLKTNWIDFKGSASMGLDESLQPLPPLDIQLNIKEYADGLRSILEMFAYELVGQELPEENSLSFHLMLPDLDSDPEITIE